MESHGWRLFVHPLLERQLEKLASRVERLVSIDSQGYASHPLGKRLRRDVREWPKLSPADRTAPDSVRGIPLEAKADDGFGPSFHGGIRPSNVFPSQQKT